MGAVGFQIACTAIPNDALSVFKDAWFRPFGQDGCARPPEDRWPFRIWVIWNYPIGLGVAQRMTDDPPSRYLCSGHAFVTTVVSIALWAVTVFWTLAYPH